MERTYHIHTEATASFQCSDVAAAKHVMRSDAALIDDLPVALNDVTRGAVIAGVVLSTSLVVGKNPALPAYFAWAILMGLIAVIDLEQLRVPNRLVAIAAAVMFPLLAVATTANIAGTSFSRAIAGSFALLFAYLLLHMIAPSSMGMGDVKLAFVIGGHLAFFGWNSVFDATLAAFGAMAIVGLALIAFGPGSRRTSLPFAPFMIFGAIVALGLAG